MTITELKETLGVEVIDFIKTEKGRFMATVGDQKILSRTEFDPNLEIFAVKNNILADTETGEIVPNLWWLTNKKPAEIALSL